MKQWTVSLLATALLLSATGCGAAAATPSTMATTELAAPPAVVSSLKAETDTSPAKASGTLSITLRDCNTVKIQEAVGSTLGLVDPRNNYKAKVGAPSGGVTKVEITAPKPGTWKDDAEEAVFTIPQGAYASIVVDAADSGVSLTPVAANYRITAQESAVSVEISQGYSGKVDLQTVECAASLNFMGQMQNATFDLRSEESAVSLPEGWAFKLPGESATLTRGTGAAKITVSAKECALRVEEGNLALKSNYHNVSKSTSGTINADTGEVYQISNQASKDFQSNKISEMLKANERAGTPNAAQAIKTIPAAGITMLRINASLCGVAVEPSKSGQFELSYIGVKDTKRYTVATAVENGTLTVTAEGTRDVLHYLQTEPGQRVNTVLVGVPANVLKGLVLDCGGGSILINGIDLPIQAVESSGLIRVKGDMITQAIQGACGSGCIGIQGKTISGKVDLSAENGSVQVKATTVTGDVVLSAENGMVFLQTASASGEVDLSAENGAVRAEVDQLKNATLKAENGTVTASVGVIGETFSAQAENGKLDIQLTQAPKNLTFHLNQRDDWHGQAKNLNIPTGWSDGYTIGNGKPELNLGIENGTCKLTVGK